MQTIYTIYMDYYRIKVGITITDLDQWLQFYP
jgi:hypothetical protein